MDSRDQRRHALVNEGRRERLVLTVSQAAWTLESCWFARELWCGACVDGDASWWASCREADSIY